MTGAAPEQWSAAVPPGGMVCAVPDLSRPDGICGMPVESEPCNRHAAATAPGQAELPDGVRYRLASAERDKLSAELTEAREWLGDVTGNLRAAREQRDKLAAELQGVHGELRAHGIEGDPANHWAPLLVSMLARQRDEAREQLVTARQNGAYHESQVLSLTAELATCRERNAAIAAQSDQYRDQQDEAIAGFIDTADRDEYQLVITEMLDWFWEPDDGGQVPDAPETRAKVADWRKRADLEPLS